jgi:hypothetical protein
MVWVIVLIQLLSFAFTNENHEWPMFFVLICMAKGIRMMQCNQTIGAVIPERGAATLL